MAVPSRSVPPARVPSTPSTTDDWPIQATDGIIKLVDSVRDKTTGPAIRAARIVKYGLAAALFATIATFLVVIALIRGLESIFVNVFHLEDPIWLVYLIIGLIFVGLGLLLWGRTHPKAPDY